MEQERFDQLARGLASGRSRRGVVRHLAGTALGGVLAAVGASEVGARQHRKQDGKSSIHQAGAKAKNRKKKHPCPDGQTRCKVGRKHGNPKKACVDLKKDPNHCGQCATVCASDELCLGGVCKVCTPQCQGIECGDDGCAGNCGTCASGKHCQQGHCVTEGCPGGCGPHGSCEGDACVCDAGFKTCLTDPCGTDITTDPANCGACGNVCGPHTTCSGGACVCAPDCTGKCDGASDGCGGTCDGVCDPCPPYEIRSAGVCVFPCSIAGTCASCVSGFVQCVGNPDGTHICATNLTFNSADHCEVNGCPDGFTCYSGGGGSYTCFEVTASEMC